MTKLQSASVLLLLILSVVIFSATSSVNDGNGQKIAGHDVWRVYRGTSTHSTNLAVPLALFEDHAGVFWVTTLQGVYAYDEIADRWTALVDDRGRLATRFVNRVSQSDDGKLFFRSAALRSVITYLGGNFQEIDKLNTFPLRPSAVMLTSASGSVWIAQEEGIFRYNRGRWSTAIMPPDMDLSSANTPITELPGKDRKRITVAVSIGIEDREGELWMATQNSVLRIGIAQDQWTIYPLPKGLTAIFTMYQDPVGKIWFADTTGHACAYNKAKSEWSPTFNLAENVSKLSGLKPSLSFAVNGICRDGSGQMMFATEVGLICFQEDNNVWALFTSENSSLPDNAITCIIRDTTGRVWLGTGKGIVILDK